MKGKSDINYVAKDFESYYTGAMTGAEMYALEKAALADPFLQEALDGFAHTKHATADVDLLQEKLRDRLKEKDKATVIFWQKKSILKVAVLIAFLAGSAYWLLTQNNNVIDNSNLASSTPSEIKESKVVKNETNIEKDNKLPENPQVTNTAPVIELNKNVTDDKLAKVVKPTKKGSQESEILKTESLDESMVNAAAPTTKIENAAGDFLLKGKVVNQQGEPVPFATIITSKEQINADITGNFAAFVKDSSVYGNVVASGYIPLQKQLNYNLSQTIVLQTDIAKANKISEEIKAESAKKVVVSVRGNSSKVSEEEANKNILVPVNGWEAYKQYLQDSVRYQHDKREMVALSFSISSSGRPQEIKVLDGLCLPCNQEAIRLLKDGPDWKPIPKGEGLLKVQF